MLATRSSKFDAQHLGRLWLLVAQNAHHGSILSNFLCIYWQPFKTILLPNLFFTRQNQVICSCNDHGNSQKLPKSVPWTQKMMRSNPRIRSVCRGTEKSLRLREPPSRKTHTIRLYILYVRVKTRQYIGSSLMTYTFDIAAKLHIQLYAYNSGIVGANRWRKCPLP